MRHLNIWLGRRVNFFWGQSIGIAETKTFQLTYFSSMKIVGLGGLWALEWTWQIFFWINR